MAGLEPQLRSLRSPSLGFPGRPPLLHTCHFLPFQPILWNRCFPSEPVKSAQNSLKSISEGVWIWQVCKPRLLRSAPLIVYAVAGPCELSRLSLLVVFHVYYIDINYLLLLCSDLYDWFIIYAKLFAIISCYQFMFSRQLLSLFIYRCWLLLLIYWFKHSWCMISLSLNTVIELCITYIYDMIVIIYDSIIIRLPDLICFSLI